MGKEIIGKALDIITFLMDADKGLVWKLTPYKKKKTLSQNGYYWQLVGELAKESRVSINRIHNIHLRQLAQIDANYMYRMGGRPATVFIPDTDEAENEALEQEKFHIKPTSAIRVGDDGITYRGYIVIRGCSTFDVEEMSALLDLLIQDCQAVGIQTMTSDEIAHMRELEKACEERSRKHRNK